MIRVDRLVIATVAIGSVAVAALLPTTMVSGAGVVRAAGTPLTGGSRLSPGDWVAAGYEIAFVGNHPAASVRLAGGAASLGLSCSTTAAPQRWLTIGLAGATAPIGSGDPGWRPAAGAGDPASYHGSAQVPDVCGGGQIYVNTASAPSVLYGGTVISNDTTDPLVVRFHAVTASGRNCASALDNPVPGQAACAGVWGPGVRTTAAPLGTPTPSSSPSPSSASPSSSPSASSSPSSGPSASPSASPRPSATPSPRPSPSASPSASATPRPSSSASPSATAAATPTPTVVATASPSAVATAHPTVSPTRNPARSPASAPSPSPATATAGDAGTAATPVALAQLPVSGTNPSPPAPPTTSVAPPAAVLPSLTPARPIVWYVVLGLGDLLLFAWLVFRHRRRRPEPMRS